MIHDTLGKLSKAFGIFASAAAFIWRFEILET